MIDITLKNYRCFSQSDPVRLSIRPGLTAFLGINNSGKSSLLRLFFELRNLFGFLSGPNGNLLAALQGQRQGLSAQGLLDPTEFFPRGNQADTEISFSFEGEAGGKQQQMKLLVTLYREGISWDARLEIPGSSFERSSLVLPDPILRSGHTPIADLSPLFQNALQLTRTCYLPAFRNAINTGTKGDYYDISVGEGFVQNFRQWKTGPSIAQNEASRRLISDIQEIFGLDQFDINASPDNTTLQLFINNRSFRLHELGSGLAQFILVFANVVVKRPAFILIDEPELSLHPSLQLKFLSRLLHYASEGVLFATHSYGLARASADQIYTLRKVAEDESRVTRLEATQDLPHLLSELTYSSYRDLAFEKILLVEGPNDLPVLRHFLRLLKKDHQIVLLSLGGDNMINGGRAGELDELKRISPNLAAVIDSERSSSISALSKNREDFVAVCQAMSVPCHVLERRAIENYFSDVAVKKVKGNSYRALNHFERFKEVPLEWSKETDNWRVALEMNVDELLRTDLGAFLKSV